MYYNLQIVKSLSSSSNSNIIRGFASVETLDRQNTVVDLRTMDLSYYKANPIILYNHNNKEYSSGIFPIGRSLDVDIVDVKKLDEEKYGIYKSGILTEVFPADKVPSGLENFTALYCKAEITNENILQRIHRGELNAFSIAAFSKRAVNENGIDIYKNSALFEISVVPTPSNQDSLFVLDEIASVEVSNEIAKSYETIKSFQNNLGLEEFSVDYDKNENSWKLVDTSSDIHEDNLIRKGFVTIIKKEAPMEKTEIVKNLEKVATPEATAETEVKVEAVSKADYDAKMVQITRSIEETTLIMKTLSDSIKAIEETTKSFGDKIALIEKSFEGTTKQAEEVQKKSEAQEKTLADAINALNEQTQLISKAFAEKEDETKKQKKPADPLDVFADII